jgi:multidrug efflux system membrane fusion protein
MDRQTKIAAAAVLGAVSIGCGALIFGSAAHGTSPPPAPPAAEVDVAEVVSVAMIDYQQYSGRLEAIERVDIRPLVGGTIVAVRFKDGALVQKGDPLFEIDPRPFQAEADRAAAQLATALANARFASVDAERAGHLLLDHAVSRRDADQTVNAASATEANVLAARAALQLARLNLGYAHVTAPVTGRVSRAELTLGNVVAAGAGAPVLCTLVSVAPIYAAFEIDEQTYLRYLGRSRQGTHPVTLGLADETAYSRSGTIDSVDNRLDKQSGTIRVRARFDNADGLLLPGLYARVKVGGGAAHPALLVDDAAIGTDQEKKFVLVLDGASRVQYRQVVPGQLYEGRRVVEQGLKAGERIVVGGLQRVRPNDQVKARSVPMPPAAASRSGA